MFINQTNSTNDYLKQHPDCDAVWTSWQTAGRGQAGNSWESEQGKNVLFSLRFRHPHVSVEQQFRLTMAVSLGVHEVVKSLVPQHEVTVKWPNDIYIANRKVCGILIENTLSDGMITESVVGVGLNVNQTTWLSDAPNPVSLKQLTDIDYDLPTIYALLCETIYNKVSLLDQPELLKQQYLSVLFRYGKPARYACREVSLLPSRILTVAPDNAFEAVITEVTEQGELMLQTANGIQSFHFKQIQFIL